MKKLITITAMFVALAVLVTPALAGPPPSYDCVVEGQNNPAVDISNVQMAVDTCDTILLKGEFDFGTGSVWINRDVQIFGETDNKGEPLTKINGGFSAFFNMPLLPPPLPPGPKIEVRNIHFDGAIFSPIHLTYTSRAVISGNKITNVEPMEIIPPPPGFTYWQIGAVIWTGGFSPLGAVMGVLTFENNQVDMDTGSYDPEQTMGMGVFFNSTWGATINITGNSFENASRISIYPGDNYLDENGTGRVTIARNTVITPTAGPAYPNDTRPIGIVAGWEFDLLGATDPTKYSPIFIEHNDITMTSGFAKTYPEAAISLLSDGGVIRQNHIVVGGAPLAGGIGQFGSYGLIANNKIEGSGWCALLAWGAMPGVYDGSYNTFRGNNISHFSEIPPDGFDVILYGNNNRVNGGTGTAFDGGTDNVINGDYFITP